MKFSRRSGATMRRLCAGLGAAAAVLALPIRGPVGAAVAVGQQVPRPPANRVGDPPGRVGRLAALGGAVSFQPASDTEWTVAESNRPVTTGDRLWSDADGRAEIDAGSALVRIWYQTELDVTRLDDRMLQIGLPQGSATLRVNALPDGSDIEIDAPNAAVSLGGSGEYRIDVSADGLTTTVSVVAGTAQVTSAGSSFELVAHQMATLRGGGDVAPTYDVAATGPPDGFDQWSQSRDDRERRVTPAQRFVAADMPGARDLDDYGDWNTDSNYGPVWYPRGVAADWAPYHDGHWAWMGRWGWTWVDDAPWGYAPSHYGRWAYVNRRWGWAPGRVIAPAVFAPGLVVFVGGLGDRGSNGVGAGVAWFPLAPEEPYRPAYPVSEAYVRRVNVTNVTNITNITNITTVTNITNLVYRNRSVVGAVTAVPRNAFENAAPVARVAVRVSEADVRQATIVGAAPTVVPVRTSLVAEAARHATSKPPVQLVQRVVVAIHAPPPAAVPFAAQEKVIAANGGRPLSPQDLSTIRRAAPPSAEPTERMHPARSAAEPAARGAELKAARAGLPEARPAVERVTQARLAGRSIPAPAPAPLPAPTVINARQTIPPAQPPVAPSEAHPSVARPPVSLGSRSLDSSYAVERTHLEVKHVQEFAKPPATISPKILSEKQDSEHAALESRYQRAAARGRPAMPSAEPSSPPAARGRKPTTPPAKHPPARPDSSAKPAKEHSRP